MTSRRVLECVPVISNRIPGVMAGLVLDKRGMTVEK